LELRGSRTAACPPWRRRAERRGWPTRGPPHPLFRPNLAAVPFDGRRATVDERDPSVLADPERHVVRRDAEPRRGRVDREPALSLEEDLGPDVAFDAADPPSDLA